MYRTAAGFAKFSSCQQKFTIGLPVSLLNFVSLCENHGLLPLCTRHSGRNAKLLSTTSERHKCTIAFRSVVLKPFPPMDHLQKNSLMNYFALLSPHEQLVETVFHVGQ